MRTNTRGSHTLEPAGAPIDDGARGLFWTVTHFRRWATSVFPMVSEGYDISPQQLNVLYLVRTQGATMAEIARQLVIAPTVVTGLVDRLEARGMIERQPDRTDRRKLQLVLTDQGRRASVDIESRFATRVEAAMDQLSSAKRAEMSRGLEILREVIVGLERDATASADS